MSRKKLPFIRFYVNDYMGDTAHLECVEHGAYMLILWAYWQRQEPPVEPSLSKIVKLPSEQWALHRDVLAEFFTIKDGIWRHRRIELELKRVRDEVKSKRKAGLASAAKRALNSTGVEQVLDECSTGAQRYIRSNEPTAVPKQKPKLVPSEDELMKAREILWQHEAWLKARGES